MELIHGHKSLVCPKKAVDYSDKCPFCDHIPTFKHNLKRHIQRRHGPEKVFGDSDQEELQKLKAVKVNSKIKQGCPKAG